MDSEISRDGSNWIPLRQVTELIPEVLQDDSDDEQARERLAAARRWADERRRERRAGDEDEGRKGPGRRARESYATLEYRDHREQVVQTLRPARERKLAAIVFVLLLLGGGIYAGFNWTPQYPNVPKCNEAATKGINWRLCNKPGVQLLNADLNNAILNSANFHGANLFGTDLRNSDAAYANLNGSNLSFTDFRGAMLKGANLRAADLNSANFSNANLSYADLREARITNTVFINTDFSNAIWIDGRKCLPGSVGMCRSAE